MCTLALVRELIRREFRVNLSAVSVGRLLKRVGFTPQRPVYRAWQQDAAQVAAWPTTVYPQLATRVKREQALIFFGGRGRGSGRMNMQARPGNRKDRRR